MRHELKTIISLGDYLLLKKRLNALFTHDKYANANGEYVVRSIYFDDPFDSALKEKVNGVLNREKFRIRVYNHDFSRIRLEKKAKLNSLSEKIGTLISIEQTKAILVGDFSNMRTEQDPLLTEFYTKARNYRFSPKVIVEYTREPFSFAPGNVRITLDHSIKTGLLCQDFFNKQAPLLKAGDDFGVMEVKFNQFLPEIVGMAVSLPQKRISAYSKYALCRRYE